MPRAVQLLSSDWVVFIDGVQVPWLNITMSSRLDDVAAVMIDVEPDYVVTLFRPGAVAAVFCRDQFDGKTFSDRSAELLDGFVYFAGGELATVEDVQEPQSRYQRLVFKADIDHLARHSAFAAGVGGNSYFGYVLGSKLTDPWAKEDATPRQDSLSFLVLARSFAKDTATAVARRHRSAGSNADDFGLRMLRLVTWLCAHNASLRLQTVRSRLANKLCALDDSTLSILADVAVGTPLFSGGQMQAGAAGSVFDMVRALEARVGYRMATVFAPSYPEEQPRRGQPVLVPFPPGFDRTPQQDGVSAISGDQTNPSLFEAAQGGVTGPLGATVGEAVAAAGSGESDDLFKLRVDWFRNDYVFLPNLMFSAPPPCNLIFPDMLTSKRVSRSFATEPTRSVFVDPVFASGAGLVFVEAPGLASSDIKETLTPDRFWSNFQHLLTPTAKAPTESAWQAPLSGSDPGANGLDLVTDDEAERGIVVSWQQMDYEYMLAVARTLELRTADGSFNEVAADELRRQLASGDNPYCRYVQEWLRFNHRLRRWSRPSSVSLKGHKWIVPGFSTVIFGDRVSYLAYVTGVTQSISADGTENTQVELDHVRPLGDVNVDLVRESEATHAAAPAKSKAAVDDVKKAHAADLVYLRALLEHAQRAKAQGDARGEETASAEILARADSCAASMTGPNKTVAGALTAKADPDLLARSVDRLTIGKRPTPTASNAAAALRDVARFYDLQERQLAASRPAHGATPSLAQTISAARLTLAQQGAKSEALAARLERDADFPTPPAFYNQDLINLATLDDHYKRLLGCPALYTGAYAASRAVADKSPYGTHTRMLQVLSAIFPALSSALPVDLRLSPATSSWTDVQAADGVGTQRWQHENFLRRKAQTLRQYLATHGFRPALEEIMSDEPSPTVFYVMTPAPAVGAPRGPTASGQSYGWDDSVLCRLVDEKTRSGEAATGDRLMRERRARATSIFLTSGARQALVVAYSRKHFGSRGFSGE